MLAKMGRPKLEVSRCDGIFIRLTKEEHEMIKEYASKHNLTITQTLVNGFAKLMSK